MKECFQISAVMDIVTAVVVRLAIGATSARMWIGKDS
jgi:hypothetical protein